jgi:protein-tyrosine phosphatase
LLVEDWEFEPIEKYFDEAIVFIDESEKVLVHCGAGVSRSPTIVLAYLMVVARMTLREAYDLVSAQRFVQPNEGFTEKLMHLEMEQFGENSVSLDDFDFDDD